MTESLVTEHAVRKTTVIIIFGRIKGMKQFYILLVPQLTVSTHSFIAEACSVDKLCLPLPKIVIVAASTVRIMTL
jgi:hypothetical protein